MSVTNAHKYPFRNVPRGWSLLLRCFHPNEEFQDNRLALLDYLRDVLKHHLASACKEKNYNSKYLIYEDVNLLLVLDMFIEKEYVRYRNGQISFEKVMKNFYMEKFVALKDACREFLNENKGSGISRDAKFLEDIDKIIYSDGNLDDLDNKNFRESPSFKRLYMLENSVQASNEPDYFEYVQFSDDDRKNLDGFVYREIKRLFKGVNRSELKAVLLEDREVVDFYHSKDSGYSRLYKRRDRFIEALPLVLVPYAQLHDMPWKFVNMYLKCIGVRKNLPPRY